MIKKNTIYIRKNEKQFLAALYEIQQKIKKVRIYIDGYNIKDYCEPKFNGDPFNPAIEENSQLEIRYNLKNIPLEKWGEIHCDWNQILLILNENYKDGKLRETELQTTLMNIRINHESFCISPNYYVYQEKVDFENYINDLAKRMNAVINK